MSTLSDKRIVDPVLTNLSRGYSNASFVGSALFPEVEVEKEGGKIPQFNKEAFKIYNTERAIRGNSNRISPEGRSSISYALTEHDLEYPIDYREMSEDILPLEMHATTVVSEGLSLRKEKMQATLAQDLANYPSGSKVTLSGSDQFTHASSDPFAIVDSAIEAVRAKIAKRPNVMLLGPTVFKSLKNHAKVLDRIKYTMKGVVTLDILSQLFNIENLFVGDAVFASDSDAFSDIWSDNVILAYVPKTMASAKRSYYEPSFAYTLFKKDYPLVDKYDEKGKLLLVRATSIFQPLIVGSEAGYLINDCCA